jgi:hypothetical protein
VEVLGLLEECTPAGASDALGLFLGSGIGASDALGATNLTVDAWTP